MSVDAPVKTKPKRKVKLDPKVRQLAARTETEGQVTVHVSYTSGKSGDELIRIWKTTFLVDRNSSHRSSLHFADNITYYPAWTLVEAGRTHVFTLVFSALPKSCVLFDLLEDIPQSGGFHIAGIKRNKSDVYRVKLV